jgi:hypothetical protein
MIIEFFIFWKVLGKKTNKKKQQKNPQNQLC